MRLPEYIGWLVLAGSLATGYVLLRLGLPLLAAGTVAAALWLGYAVWQMLTTSAASPSPPPRTTTKPTHRGWPP
jgi:hypothetical protein